MNMLSAAAQGQRIDYIYDMPVNDDVQSQLVSEPSVAANRNGAFASAGEARLLVVPIHWRKFTAQLIVCMELRHCAADLLAV